MSIFALFNTQKRKQEQFQFECDMRQCEIDLASAIAEQLTSERKENALEQIKTAQQRLDQKRQRLKDN